MDLYLLSLVLLHLLNSVTASAITNYTTARDYTVTSENYPQVYPGNERVVWRWMVPDGMWAVLFEDFKLRCGGDTLDNVSIKYGKNMLYYFSCNNVPVNRHYILNSSSFTMEFSSSHEQRDVDAKGFKCKVFFGQDRAALNQKIDETRFQGVQNPDVHTGGSVSHETVIVLLVVIVALITTAIIIVGVVLCRRRRHQQTTNTSVHLNIGAIRRESAVSYTRNGTGGLPGEGRSRMGSESSLPPDDVPTTPKRPVKRSGSNASWAMRAEMSTSIRNGSCSSEGHAQHTHRAVNLYTPMPGEASSSNGVDFDVEHSEGSPRLSTIPEEPRLSGGKVKATMLVPKTKGNAGLAVDNAGYILMTSCSANYTNFV